MSKKKPLPKMQAQGAAKADPGIDFTYANSLLPAPREQLLHSGGGCAVVGQDEGAERQASTLLAHIIEPAVLL